MLSGCCPCGANSIISLQSWKTCTSCLLSKWLAIEYCCSLFKLSMVKHRHTSPSGCLYILQMGACNDRPNISSKLQDAVWKGLADAVLRMLLHHFGTIYLHLLDVLLKECFQETNIFNVAYPYIHWVLFCTSILFGIFLMFLTYRRFWERWLLTIQHVYQITTCYRI